MSNSLGRSLTVTRFWLVDFGLALPRTDESKKFEIVLLAISCERGGCMPQVSVKNCTLVSQQLYRSHRSIASHLADIGDLDEGRYNLIRVASASANRNFLTFFVDLKLKPIDRERSDDAELMHGISFEKNELLWREAAQISSLKSILKNLS